MVNFPVSNLARLFGEGLHFTPRRKIWRGGEVVTRESAKLLCEGSIPFRASRQFETEEGKSFDKKAFLHLLHFMNKERQITSEALKKGGVLVAILSAVVENSVGVFTGILSYFVGDYIKPKAAH